MENKEVLEEGLDFIIKEQMERFYSEMLSYVESGQHDLQVDPRTCAMTALLEKHVPKDARVVDVGAGLGDLLADLKDRGFSNLAGIDFSEVAVKHSKKRFGDEIPLYRRDITRPSQLEGIGPYDVVIMGDILEHIWAPKRALLNLRKILADGGKFLVSVPNAGFIVNGLLLSFFPRQYFLSVHLGTWTHINTYTKHRIREHLKTCGYKPEVITGCPTRTIYPKQDGLKRQFKRFFLLSLLRFAELSRPLSARLFSQNLIVLAQKVGDKDVDIDPLSPFTI